MRLTVDHSSTYTYEHGVSYALQQVRKRPISLPSQSILSWDVSIEGAHWETSYTDHHGNLVDLIQLEPDVMSVSVSVKGEVETHDTSGVMGAQSACAALALPATDRTHHAGERIAGIGGQVQSKPVTRYWRPA